ncbi:hypothetical protein GLOIN_2v1543171 [Rhizophagus clarus]|uniref:Uncharacterized protein n=1 Tax=Rhizophagus clarus TaxID=94130 RepID=A0A8H3R0G2_9GLOM|nr:hypothetical protein GLOIN_2v1543171 [Rhizophagus clarus]
MDQQNVRKVVTHNYPEDSIIEYSESGRSYTYNIIKEGYYPPVAYLRYTKRQNGCIIKYVEKNLVYWIYYGNEYQYQIKSEKSSSDAASSYAKALDPETKTRYSRPHVFGLQLEVLQQARDTKRQATTLKPFNNLTITDKITEQKKLQKLIGKEDVEDTKHKTRQLVHIDDADIINNVQQSIGKVRRRNIIDILKYLIPGLIKKGVIHVANLIEKTKKEGLIDNQGLHSTSTFDMIPLQNWVPSELHMMLCIMDVFWRLDKLTVLQHFDLSKLLPHSRAVQIRSLWNNFYLLHNAVKDPKTDVMFSNDACAWLHQFLDSGFYQTSDITPYMHVLVYHPRNDDIHHHFDGGGKERKSAILDILECENRVLSMKLI